MDTIFESNKFNTLEIEQGDTTNGEAFAKKTKQNKKNYWISGKNSGRLQPSWPGLFQSPTNLWHCDNPTGRGKL